MDSIVATLVTVFTEGDTEVMEPLFYVMGVGRCCRAAYPAGKGLDLKQVLSVFLGKVLAVHLIFNLVKGYVPLPYLFNHLSCYESCQSAGYRPFRDDKVLSQLLDRDWSLMFYEIVPYFVFNLSHSRTPL